MKDKKDKIYYFQEKSNDILDLQDELTNEEIGIYFILKAGYFKYAGELKKENVRQRCKFFGNIEKINQMISKIFNEVEGSLINNSWLSEINGIREVSKKRSQNAKSRWYNNANETIETKPAKIPKKPKANPKEPKETHNNFETFWDFYTPVAGRDGTSVSKGNKADAKKSYDKAINLNFTHEAIMQALEFYLKECQKNARFTKHVVSWLNQGIRDEFKLEQSAVIQPQPQPQKLTPDQLQDQINEELIKRYSTKNANN